LEIFTLVVFLVVNNISFWKLFSKRKKRKRIKEGIKEKWIRPHAIRVA
jgi:hypothetical protein